MYLKITCLFVTTLLYFSAIGQNYPIIIRSISIGDTVPEGLIIKNVSNYSTSEIQLSSLRGKLVILDFWATWCSSCLEGFPKAEELQRKFGNKLQIILVNADTSETIAKVTAFLQKREQRTDQKLALPYATQNAFLNDCFSFKEVPHYVWINKAGKVVGITTSNELTAKNVSAFLNDPTKTLFTKRDDLRFNDEKPVLIDENGGDNPTGFIFRSIFTGYKEYLGATFGTNQWQEGKITRFYALNAGLLQLLQISYIHMLQECRPETTIVESSRYTKEQLFNRAELPENRYCYESIQPTISNEELRRNLQKDIERVFGLIPKKEVRPMECFILTSTNLNTINTIRTKEGEFEYDIEESSEHKQLANAPVQTLCYIIQFILHIPVVNETHIDYNIDMLFPNDILTYNTEALNKFLKTKGLQLTPAKKDIEVIVITDKIK